MSPDENDALQGDIRLAEEKIENKIAAEKMKKFHATLAAIAKERKKFKPKGK